ncbi:MAG: hypothetical protein N3F66_07380 [Spirochaetes bacterium]|nr:hypothetical protein [Spirochaetota bacterium]
MPFAIIIIIAITLQNLVKSNPVEEKKLGRLNMDYDVWETTITL